VGLNIFNGYEYLQPKEFTAMELKTEAALAVKFGETALDFLFRVASQFRQMFSSVLTSFFTTIGLVKDAEKSQEPISSSKRVREESNQQTKNAYKSQHTHDAGSAKPFDDSSDGGRRQGTIPNLWSNLMEELQRSWSDAKDIVAQFKQVVKESFEKNEILSLVWTVVTDREYTFFLVGAILPVFLPHLLKRSHFHQLLEWINPRFAATLISVLRRKNAEAEDTTADTGDAGDISGDNAADDPGDAGDNPSEARDNAANAADASNNAADAADAADVSSSMTTDGTLDPSPPLPFLDTTTHARSAPSLHDPHHDNVDTIWRNCNSEVLRNDDVARGDVARGDVARDEDWRQAARTRKDRPGIPTFGINDLRRAAPPPHARRLARSAVEEVERRRREKIESARLLDEEEFSDAKDQMTNNGVGDPEATLPKTFEGQSDHYGSSSENRDDGDTTTYMNSTNEESQREPLNERVRGVLAELQELSALVESSRETADTVEF